MAQAMWTVIVTDQKGKVIGEFPWQQGSLTIGRDQSRSIALPSKTASRKHARLDLINGMPVVIDEGSANGTQVNGATIKGPTRIDETSKVDVGEYRITLQRAMEEDDGERTVMMKPKGFGTAAPAPPVPPRPTAAPPRPAAPPPPPPRPAMPAMPSMPAPAMPAMPAMPKASESMGDITSQFERQLQSVRAYREEAQSGTLNKKAKVDALWTTMITNMRSLQNRLRADKRVLAFDINRDATEVSVKVADAREKRGHRYFMLTRNHPEGKYTGLEVVYVREFGREDLTFDEPAKAMEELIMRIAATLA
jgi:pSer/pThr/pTyr-binding forkhead associated (FHA) protein